MVELTLDGPFFRWDGKFVVLSSVQTGLMEVFLRHQNEPLSAQALRCLTNSAGADGTVIRVHIKLLRRKLVEPVGNPRLLRTVRGHGYMLVTDDKIGELLDRKYDGLGRFRK